MNSNIYIICRTSKYGRMRLDELDDKIKIVNACNPQEKCEFL